MHGCECARSVHGLGERGLAEHLQHGQHPARAQDREWVLSRDLLERVKCLLGSMRECGGSVVCGVKVTELWRECGGSVAGGWREGRGRVCGRSVQGVRKKCEGKEKGFRRDRGRRREVWRVG